MNGIACVKDLIRSYIDSIGEVSKRCNPTREKEIQSEESRSSIDSEVIKSDRAGSPVDLTLELSISFEDSKKIFKDVVDAMDTTVIVVGRDALEIYKMLYSLRYSD